MKRKRRTNPSDGFAIFKTSQEEEDVQVPIVFAQSTFVKLILWTLGPLLIFISTALYFYHKTNVHMDDKNIHLGDSERLKIQTKEEAKNQFKKAKEDIKEHVDIKVREIKVEQKEQLDNTKRELKKQQYYHYNKILEEIRKRR